MNDLKRILLAEDNKNDIELTIAALREIHLSNQIDVVHDGNEVLDYLYCRGKFAERDSGLPIVIMLDIKMPGKDGMEVLEDIKNDEELKHIPIVMLTSSSIDKDILQSYKIGANAYVVKPVDYDGFMDAIRTLGIFWALLNKTSHI